MKDMIHYIAMLPAIAIAISIFNYAQAKMAIHLGDTTPRQWGRDTINPFAHIDLLGILVLGQFGFLGAVIRPVFAVILGIFESIVHLIL